MNQNWHRFFELVLKNEISPLFVRTWALRFCSMQNKTRTTVYYQDITVNKNVCSWKAGTIRHMAREKNRNEKRTCVKQIATFIMESAVFFVFTGVKCLAFFASMFCKAWHDRRVKLCFDIIRLINNYFESIYQKLSPSTQFQQNETIKCSPRAKNNSKASVKFQFLQCGMSSDQKLKTVL